MARSVSTLFWWTLHGDLKRFRFPQNQKGIVSDVPAEDIAAKTEVSTPATVSPILNNHHTAAEEHNIQSWLQS